MPETWIGWSMFAFFAIGAAGGCLVWVLIGMDAVRSFRLRSAIARRMR